MDRPIINTFGLCSGVGMLETGVGLGFDYLGLRHRCAGLCEWEAFAASVLLARMEDSSLEAAPVWCGDLKDLDCRSFRGLVDILIAGLPCQADSVAGKRIGNSDPRAFGEDGEGPRGQALRIIRELAPAMAWFENVPRWVTGGSFERFGDALSLLGYEIEDPIFITAKAVGASHKRERVFVLAYRQDSLQHMR